MVAVIELNKLLNDYFTAPKFSYYGDHTRIQGSLSTQYAMPKRFSHVCSKPIMTL